MLWQDLGSDDWDRTSTRPVQSRMLRLLSYIGVYVNKSKTVCPLTTTLGNCNGPCSLISFWEKLPKVDGIRTRAHFAFIAGYL